MNKLTNVQLGYTDNGNQYKKTNAGKKAGTLTGAVAGGACMADVRRALANRADKITERKLAAAFNSFTKFDKAAGKVTVDTFTTGGKKTLKTVAEKVVTSKYGRAALVAGAVAGVILAGKALGSMVDAAVNKFKAHKTDKSIEQKEAIISEYEASKADEK